MDEKLKSAEALGNDIEPTQTTESMAIGYLDDDAARLAGEW
jgi:hypothetical protein